MELNREQAIDILERFDFFQGQRAGRELWNDKPFDVQEQDIANFSRDVSLLKNYIKELTEENERLQAEITHLEGHREADIKAFKTLKADTVRKMQERIKEYFPYDADSGLYVVLDQIAKEMVEDLNRDI